jgi:membrane fusion protein, heavy metal efflux system
VNLVTVDHPEQFPLVTAGKYDAAPELNVTGTVTPDVSRNIPVISLASGRIVEIDARLGDTVTKGPAAAQGAERRTSPAHSPITGRRWRTKTLAKAQLERAKLLLEKGAIAQKDL